MRIRPTALPILAVVGLALLFLAPGCGGGSNDGAGSSASAAGGADGSTADGTEAGPRKALRRHDREVAAGKENASQADVGGGSGANGNSGSAPPAEANGNDTAKKAGGAAQSAARAKFIREADAICAAVHRRILVENEKYLQNNPDNVVKKAPEVVNNVLAPRLEAEERDVRALTPPPGSAAELQAIFTAIQETLGRARANPEQFAIESNQFERSEQLGEKFGFTSCGSP